MASSLTSKSPRIHLHRNPISLHLPLRPFALTVSLHPSLLRNSAALRTRSTRAGIRNTGGQDAYTSSDLLTTSVVSSAVGESTRVSSGEWKYDEYDADSNSQEEEGWINWEDKILEDTAPLVGFVRMILHSGKYECGDRLSPAHEKTILDRLLAYHPKFEQKIGSGVDYITIGIHPDFGTSRCLFIVRKEDGERVDFSYWKCIKSLIRTKYPLHAENFIRRHFHQRRSD